MPNPRVKQLLVEGKDDVYAVAGLMGHFVNWGKTEDEWPVYIRPAGSAAELLSDKVLPTYLKGSEVHILGVLIDANDSLDAKWQRIRQLCEDLVPGLPQTFPERGLIHPGQGGPRFGVWIMPDNRSRGMLETFLTFLVPTAAGEIWDLAKESANEAAGLGAPFKPAHRDKAEIHTWLAWQDPPGQPLGQPVRSKCLDPNADSAAPFVKWFTELFELPGSPG